MNAPVSTTAIGLLCNRKYCTQLRLRNPVPRMKRQRSLTEAVRISVGSTTRHPKTLRRWQANTSQWQIIRCTVSTSYLQNLQAGSPTNRPMVRRCVLTAACPVRIATTILSGCLLKLSRSAELNKLVRPETFGPYHIHVSAQFVGPSSGWSLNGWSVQLIMLPIYEISYYKNWLQWSWYIMWCYKIYIIYYT
jgi:hypothetical protein